MIPAIDNSADNVIYINQGHLPDDLSLFTTLAHEGYPGHLYQTMNRLHHLHKYILLPHPISTPLEYRYYSDNELYLRGNCY